MSYVAIRCRVELIDGNHVLIIPSSMNFESKTRRNLNAIKKMTRLQQMKLIYGDE